METPTLTQTEQLQKIRDAIKTAQDKISLGNDRLQKLNAQRDEIMIENALSGDKGESIANVAKEIAAIKQDIEDQDKIVTALQGKVKRFERLARFEEKIQNDVERYKKAVAGLQELFLNLPTLEAITREVEALERYTDALKDNQREFLTLSKGIADFIEKENAAGLGDIMIDTLRADRAAVDYAGILELSDAIIAVGKRLNTVQFRLFNIAGNAGAPQYQFTPEPVPVQAPEISSCGRYMRKRDGNTWMLYEKETRPKPDGFGEFEDYWNRIASGLCKPNFPGPDGVVTWQESEIKVEPAEPAWKDQEICRCGLHRLGYFVPQDSWYLQEKTHKDDKNFSRLLERRGRSEGKPEFPCADNPGKFKREFQNRPENYTPLLQVFN